MLLCMLWKCHIRSGCCALQTAYNERTNERNERNEQFIDFFFIFAMNLHNIIPNKVSGVTHIFRSCYVSLASLFCPENEGDAICRGWILDKLIAQRKVNCAMDIRQQPVRHTFLSVHFSSAARPMSLAMCAAQKSNRKRSRLFTIYILCSIIWK